jgi:hypothetical protein
MENVSKQREDPQLNTEGGADDYHEHIKRRITYIYIYIYPSVLLSYYI